MLLERALADLHAGKNVVIAVLEKEGLELRMGDGDLLPKVLQLGTILLVKYVGEGGDGAV